MIAKELKEKIIKKFRIHPTDTGSSNIQIAILTEEIKELTEHLKIHRKDHSSRRGLLMKVNERRKLLKYLFKSDPDSYFSVVKKLGLKHNIGLKKVQETLDIEESIEELEKLAKKEKKEKAKTSQED